MNPLFSVGLIMPAALAGIVFGGIGMVRLYDATLRLPPGHHDFIFLSLFWLGCAAMSIVSLF